MTTPLLFDNPAPVTFSVDRETRTIRGLALPFGDVAMNRGARWRFSAGTLTWADRVKVLDGHDWSRAFGLAELTETAEGIDMVAKIARGARGDEILALAEAGVYDGLSVALKEGLGYEVADDGVYDATSGEIGEVSITPLPAFERAKVTSVAASAIPPKENTPMTDTTVDLTKIEAQFSALEAKIEGLASIKEPVAPPAFTVNEAPLYRFDGLPSQSGHDLSTDLFAGLAGDGESMARVLGFMSESIVNPNGLAFVDSTDVSSVNPPTYRPDMFKDEQPAQPAVMYDTFYAGALSSVTPFFYSQFKAASGLIGPHTQGTPPTAGTFQTETGATVTPTPESGRIFVTREVADQGGSPNVSGLIWAKFQRAFREMLERRAAKVLHDNLASFAELAAPTTGADGAALGAALKMGLVDLAFTPNGQRFRKFFSAKDLYAVLSTAEDSAGRPLYPILAPANADGTTGNRLGSIGVAGINLEPAWSTEIEYAAETDDTSYYVDPDAVKVWNSGLHKIDKVGETAAGWNIDVFAYVAAHLYDATGVRKVTYQASA